MLRIIVRRLLISIPLLFVVSVITFVLQSFVPGDPARSLLGVFATPEQYAALRQTLHLNEPILGQYWIYLTGVFHGDLGTSIFTGDPVLTTLGQRVPVSLSIILGGTLVSALIGISLGVFSATRGRVLRRVIDVVSLAGFALPNFWVGLVLASIFAVSLAILPATGYIPFAQSPSGWAQSLILPVAALALYGIASIAKVARDGVMTAMGMDYIRTLRASGVPERSLVWKHALRNSGLSISTMIGLVFVGSLSGTIMVEYVFVLPGLGSLAVDATNKHDIPVIQGVALAFTVLVVIVNLIVDIAYGIIDPKVRLS
ncbi:ABC transporter permease [Leifsonia sp. Root112D2]|uniref:ABC transporter permease n=1 Tax=Leifsonia sp. Root112D2 TaxID=1736426 RepID=UPI0007019136|nr:ABC transporter permease [Leifsonia sp. Root112D2]KQV07251.1 ABC transporter permease [Leifsonia sp. Root112D2]